MANIKAIETRYNGRRFRSRLEARWAVFFDTLGVPYSYEPEGYELDGVRYLPDFWLPAQRVWFEVKSPVLSRDERDAANEKASRLAAASGHSVVMFGDCVPWMPQGPDFKTGVYWRPNGEFDGLIAWLWCSNPLCDQPGMGHAGYHVDGESFFAGAWQQGCGENPADDRDQRIMNAFHTAMSARFEHGERG